MRILLLLILVSFTISCTKINESNSSKNLIEQLVLKYPELATNYRNEKSIFKLTRQIIDNNWQLEFELYNNPTNNTAILIVIKDFQSYVIPLFASDQAYYWQMNYGDSAPVYKQKITTTFEEELKASNKKLKIIKQNFFYFRYVLIQVLQLREEGVAEEPGSRKTGFPMRANYSGEYNITMTLHSRDSLSLTSTPIYRCGYDEFNK